MIVRFIHTADWQLGKPFTNLPPELAGELAAARFKAVTRIAEVAARKRASHVLVAGDVFDSEDAPAITLRRAFARMAEHTTVTWVLLPGNHDPNRRGGIWDRAARLEVPPNVIVAAKDAPLTLSKDAVVLPAPLTSKSPGRDPTLWMQDAATGEGVTRIGLAHGSVQGFGSDGESAVAIAKDRARSAGLAYLALGDWHGTTKVTPDTWYAGTPEPDRFPANNPGNVLAVTLSAGAPPAVEIIKTAEFLWSEESRTIASVADLNALEAKWSAPGAQAATRLLRLALTGSLSLGEHAELQNWFERNAGHLRHLELDAAKLVVRPTSADYDMLGHDGPLKEAAKLLAARAADSNDPDAAIAALALQRLFGFAAEAAREAGA